MNKNTKSFHDKTLYLLGKGEDGTFYYSEWEEEDKESKREEAMGYDKPLRDLLTSENPAIVRLAKGIKKEFTK